MALYHCKNLNIFFYKIILIVKASIFYFSGETERTISDSKATTATVGLVVHAAADGLALGAAGASEVGPRKFVSQESSHDSMKMLLK